MSGTASVVTEPTPMSRERLVTLAAAGGGAALVLGSLLPWAAGPDAGGLVYGAAEQDGMPVLGSRLGLAGGDARVTLFAGAVAAASAGWLLAGRRLARPRLMLGAAGLSALAWSMLALRGLGGTAGPDGALPDLSPGVGLLLALLGAVAVLVAAAAWPRDPLLGLLARSRLADRLARRGDVVRLVETEQRLLARHLPARGWGDPLMLAESLLLAQGYLALGQVDRARHLAELVRWHAHRSLAEDPDLLTLVDADVSRVLAALP